MNNKTAKMSYTAALVAMGVISAQAAGPITVQLTGSTAFRGNVFNAATVNGGIFTTFVSAKSKGSTATSSSSIVTYDGFVGSQEYYISCNWSGSEAGIANLTGASTLQNPGFPGSTFGSTALLPGVSTIFPDVNGNTNGLTPSGADLSLADTSQAVSLTARNASKPLTLLTDEGTVAAVTFVWAKAKNSNPTFDASTSWTDLTNVNRGNLVSVVSGATPASYLTGIGADTDTVYVVGRNAGSGTRANMLCTLGKFPTTVQVVQAALNSYYPSSGVLTYYIDSANLPGGGLSTSGQDAIDSAASYPSVDTCFNNFQGTSDAYSTSGASAPNNFMAIGDDGYDSGGFVSDCLSCDSAHGAHFSNGVIIGYAGISDATHAKAGVAFSSNETSPSQPGGAVWLSFDGSAYSDEAVVNGSYSFWGHEHLYAAATPSSGAALAPTIISGILAKGGLGTGAHGTGPSAGIVKTDMNVDRPGDSDIGYPVEGNTWH